MDFRLITEESKEWADVIEFADTCSWRAGKFIADKMHRNCFVNLYEKYGFELIDRQSASWGEEEKIYMQSLR